MNRTGAKRKIEALLRMTVERGCTKGEAATARRMAESLAAKWGFTIRPRTSGEKKPDYDERFREAEKKAAARWGWEYRSCGKKSCHCMRDGSKHGPYKYRKRRDGKKISSIYGGKR